jgi:chromosome segregation ATPase
MIPWRLSFKGIRDYRPEQIDLSGIDNHVIITGPNGSGKSTITYCLGAVLYSSKVDIEGLKSRNLLPEETWKAQISLVFKNDGLMKIDAPTFIQFTVKIVQEPGQPVKKEYTISTGEEMDEWEDTVKYTSGDRYFNFSSYKKDLQQKYKVDPDVYYLIWYQQEVNQFAVMNPEERFRIFSEMHGIDEIQREWEESIEKLKETTEILRTAELNVKSKKFELGLKKNDLDKFTDNQNRLKSGGSQYIEALLQLEILLKKEKERLEDTIVGVSEDIDDVNQLILNKQSNKEGIEGQITERRQIFSLEEKQLEEKQAALSELNVQLQETRHQADQLDKELESITKRKSLMTRTEEQVKAGLERNRQELTKTLNYLHGIIAKVVQKNQAKSTLQQSIAELNYRVSEDDRLQVLHLEKLNQYKSSYAVNEKIDNLGERVTIHKDERWKLSNRLQELKEELALLEEERNLSARQSESLSYFRTHNTKAFALRELIELDEGAQLKDEKLLNAIKYTIFFHGKNVSAPNDLYHVPLMEVVPERMIESIPELHLKIKDGIREDDIPHAIKALWWTGQFFRNGPFKIQNGSLHDPMGIRGPQESERYILSKKALLARKQEVQRLIAQTVQRLSELNQQIETDTKLIQELTSVVQLIKEAEAFMSREFERKHRKEKLITENGNLKELEVGIEQLEKEKNEYIEQKVKLENEGNSLKEEAAFYEELGKLKDKYEQLQVLRGQEDNLRQIVSRKKEDINQLEIQLDDLENAIKKLERNKNNLTNEIEDSKRDLGTLTKQKNNFAEELQAVKDEMVGYVKEMNEVKDTISELYMEVSSGQLLEHIPALGQLRQQREISKITFEYARNESDIDPAAPANYGAVKEEYERIDNEYLRSKLLLEQDVERTEELKDKLETTINMRVLEIQQRFKSYMSHFQFEGEISWENYEDKRGRTHFKLFIKARKEGHRGTMEDVSTKARGGKVGKGVSGGEESLSSLLFALALLQNLYFKPGFIVLDEFDSALDENRKLKVFDLYVNELKRKLIILTPKSHENNYLQRFSKALVVNHDPNVPISKVVGIVRR